MSGKTIMSNRQGNRDAIYFIAPTRTGWRIVKALEHGPYHEKRPASWRGPYATDYDAGLAAHDLGLVPVTMPRTR